MRALVIAACVLAVPTAAHADKGKKKDKDRPKSAQPALELSGRVFARAEATETDLTPATGELLLSSARLAAVYQWKDRMRVKLSVEAAGKVAVRDAYVALDATDVLRVTAGRAKLPITTIERASAWTLPTVERGAVAIVLEDGLGLTGRRDGVAVAWSPLACAKVIVAAAQSTATTGDEPARPLADGAGVTGVVRGEVEVTDGVRLGATVSNREVNHVADVGRYWAGTLDAEVERGALRVWADLVVGESHLGDFVAAQAIVGYRFGGADKGKKYVEPYVLGAAINPTLGQGRDDLTDITLGVAGGRWKRWRVQLQGSIVNVKGLRPADLGGFDVDLDDRWTVSVQLGAVF